MRTIIKYLKIISMKHRNGESLVKNIEWEKSIRDYEKGDWEYLVIILSRIWNKNMIVFDTSFEDLYKFLLKIDSSFPVKLSDKCSIQQYVDKLISLGTLVIEKRNGEIVGIVGGYINDDNSKLAYISIVGVDSDYQKKV